MAFCPKCKARFDSESGFCPHDGTTLQPDSAPPGGAAPPATSAAASEPVSTQVKTRPKMRAMSARDSDVDELVRHVASLKAQYDDLIGKTLDGRYRIDRKIGEGGMGVVFAAKHVVIEKAVAIKVLKREVARESSTVQRFVQEAKAASRIGHPNIVDVTDFGSTEDGLTYSVMEFVEGSTLSAVIKSVGPMKASRAVPIIAQIASALAAAHEKGIVHRDVKPENVFVVDRDGRHDFVKIVDFGIAKVTPLEGNADGPRLTKAGTVFGTPEYMAPEQAAGRGDTDHRVDIYAVGTILYELLVGKVPHKSPSMVRTLAMQMLDPIPPPREVNPEVDLPAAIETAMMKSLAKDRDERYATMREFLDALTEATGGKPLTPSPRVSERVAVSSPSARTMVPSLPEIDLATLEAGSVAVLSSPPGEVQLVPEGHAAVARRRVPNEPQFVGAKSRSFDHVFDGDEDRDSGGAKKPPLWVWLAGGAAILAVAGGAWAALRGGGDAGSSTAAAMAAQDAGAAMAPADAAPLRVVEISIDAGLEVAVRDGSRIDAGTSARAGRIDAGASGTIAPLPTEPTVFHEVQIITKPDNGTLYRGDSYAGPSGTTLRDKKGSRIKITCRLPGYAQGSVDVLFDGDNDIALCRMKRPSKCVRDLKNPFDDCPE